MVALQVERRRGPVREQPHRVLGEQHSSRATPPRPAGRPRSRPPAGARSCAPSELGQVRTLNTAYDDGERPAVRHSHRMFGLGVGLYFGCPDVDAAYEHLRAHGVDAQPPTIADYGMKQLYVRDPDGYTLCFQWRA